MSKALSTSSSRERKSAMLKAISILNLFASHLALHQAEAKTGRYKTVAATG